MSYSDGVWTIPPSGAYAGKPNLTADRVVYVSSSAAASDSNDGLSWGTAKATISGALAAYSGHAVHVYVGQGVFTESGLAPVIGTEIEGMGYYLSTIALNANGTLFNLVNNSDIAIRSCELRATSSVTSGKLLELSNTFGCRLENLWIDGQSTGGVGSFSGQVGIQFDSNAGDNHFHDCTISNLGVGVQVNSQTNYFSQCRLANNINHVQGGDATGVAFAAGVNFDETTFVGAGTNYVNITGTAGAWHFDKCWFDGGATNALVVGTGTFGPLILTIRDCPSLAAQTACLTINAAGMIVLDGVRWGDPGTHPTEITVNSTNALYGYAAGLLSAQAFEIASSVFPPLWTVIGRDYIKVPRTVNANSVAIATTDTANPGLLVNVPGGIATDILDIQKAGSNVFSIDQFGVAHANALQAGSGNFLGVTAGSNIYSASGAPAAGTGSNGDFYFRNDTPGTANQRIYVKSAGSWVGIL